MHYRARVGREDDFARAAVLNPFELDANGAARRGIAVGVGRVRRYGFGRPSSVAEAFRVAGFGKVTDLTWLTVTVGALLSGSGTPPPIFSTTMGTQRLRDNSDWAKAWRFSSSCLLDVYGVGA